MDLSLIIINHNTKELTKQAVDSVLTHAPKYEFEIIIVDNSSKPSEKYEDTRSPVIIMPDVENKGFGNACNLGVERAKGNYVLFINSDIIMHKDTLDLCFEYLLNNPSTGILGVRTLLRDGTLDHACKRGFPTPAASFYYFSRMDRLFPKRPRFGAYRQSFVDQQAISEVDAVSGSFMMMPKELFLRLGGFDESIFMYAEDLDLCMQAKESGYKVIYYGGASVTHLKGQSGWHTKSEKVVHYFYDGVKIFYDKHYLKKYGPFVGMLVHLAIKAQRTVALTKIRLCKK